MKAMAFTLIKRLPSEEKRLTENTCRLKKKKKTQIPEEPGVLLKATLSWDE